MEYILLILPYMLEGLGTTLIVFAITAIVSIPLGFFLAIARLRGSKALSWIVQTYILIMRGTPLLLQLIFIYLGLPLVGITLDRLPASLLAFILNYAAYFAEIFRAGIESIPQGQYEAGRVLGLKEHEIFLKVVLPQVVKRVIPPTANELMTLVKDTSLVYVVGMGDVLRAAKIAAVRDVTLIPLGLAGVLYLIVIGILTMLFKRAETKLSYYR
ncbi:amino acid ABC transporter permease [Youngiibacter multivorans]|uniref:Polar amino acid transport system permease protein n=1 Tax=Youngiibacter multivorans TaxID=937251 RepID=A0ABS4G241_9CLOT|nr:amino acid ABC transporter permease [Youngiibacter multivorans]MBP1918604.1 polar amino acid transport system permease protein [Youngiibacter multivorans]